MSSPVQRESVSKHKVGQDRVTPTAARLLSGHAHSKKAHTHYRQSWQPRVMEAWCVLRNTPAWLGTKYPFGYHPDKGLRSGQPLPSKPEWQGLSSENPHFFGGVGGVSRVSGGNPQLDPWLVACLKLWLLLGPRLLPGTAVDLSRTVWAQRLHFLLLEPGRGGAMGRARSP